MVAFVVSVHQVGSRQQLVGRSDAHQRFAGDVHKFRQSGSRGDIDGLKVVFFNQIVNGDGSSYDYVGDDFDAQLLEVFYFGGDDFLFGQTEFRDAVNKHSARMLQGFEDGDFIAFLGQVAGAGQPRRAAADDGNFG